MSSRLSLSPSGFNLFLRVNHGVFPHACVLDSVLNYAWKVRGEIDHGGVGGYMDLADQEPGVLVILVRVSACVACLPGCQMGEAYLAEKR